MACIGLLAAASPASAVTGKQAFKIVFTADPRAGAPGRVVATGVVKGIGTDVTIAQDPHPYGSETDTDLITLPGGTITISDTDPACTFNFDPATCVAKIGTSAGTYVIVGGTGAYQGASGGGTFSANGVAVFKKTSAGCTGDLRRFTASVMLSGSITIP